MLICVGLSVPSKASVHFNSYTEEPKLVSPDQNPGGTDIHSQPFSSSNPSATPKHLLPGQV